MRDCRGGEDGDTMGIIARRVRFRRRHRSAGNGELQSTVEEYTRWQGVSVSGPRSRVRALFSLVCGGFKLRPLPRYNGRSSVQPQTAQWCFSPRPRHLYIKIIRSPPLFTTRIHSLSCFVRLLSSINRSRSFRLNALATSVKFNDLNLITGRRMKNENDWTRSCLWYFRIYVERCGGRSLELGLLDRSKRDKTIPSFYLLVPWISGMQSSRVEKCAGIYDIP